VLVHGVFTSPLVRTSVLVHEGCTIHVFSISFKSLLDFKSNKDLNEILNTWMVKPSWTNTEVLTKGLVKKPGTNTDVLTAGLVKTPGTNKDIKVVIRIRKSKVD
jgi:hypothetical protein